VADCLDTAEIRQAAIFLREFFADRGPPMI
jgi:hypothetical protein